MTDVKKLLAEATPLPWESVHPQEMRWDAATILPSGTPTNYADAALIVHAVNHLPDYEAAVDALEAISTLLDDDSPDACGAIGVIYDNYMGGYEADDWCHRPRGHAGEHLNLEDWQDFGRAALARLRGTPA